MEEVTNQDEIEVEDCEDELEESMQGAANHIHDWTDLQKDIKDHLKKLQNITIVSSESISHYFKFCNPLNQRIIMHPGKP